MPTIGELTRGKNLGKREGESLYIWTACVVCGKERWVLKWRAPSRCCSCANHVAGKSRMGERSNSWKGGRTIIHGYIGIKLQPDDFFYPMVNYKGYVPEHRLVMAKHLGRNLLSWEIVHHKNHIRNDNRIENLQLVSDDRHKQITLLEYRITTLEKQVKSQAERITMLEAENTLLSYKIAKEMSVQQLSDFCKAPVKGS